MLPIRLYSTARVTVDSLSPRREVVSVVVLGVTGHVSKHGPRSIA